MMHRKFVMKIVTGCFLLLLLCTLSGCDSSLTFPTGISGVAVEEQGGGNIYPPPPITHVPLAGAMITAQSADGKESSLTADSTGAFRIDLSPGTYQLIGQVPPGLPFVLAPPEQTVVVVPHRLT